MNQQTRISDKSLTRLIADADKVLERNTPLPMRNGGRISGPQCWNFRSAAGLTVQSQ